MVVNKPPLNIRYNKIKMMINTRIEKIIKISFKLFFQFIFSGFKDNPYGKLIA